MPVYRFYFDKDSKFVKDNLNKQLDYRFCYAIFYAESETKAKYILNNKCQIKLEDNTQIDNIWGVANVNTIPKTEISANEIEHTKNIGISLEDYLYDHESKDLQLLFNNSPDWNYKQDVTNWIDNAMSYLSIVQSCIKKGHSRIFIDQILEQSLYIIDCVYENDKKIIPLYLLKSSILTGMGQCKLAIKTLKQALDLLEKFKSGDNDIIVSETLLRNSKFSENQIKKINDSSINTVYKNISDQLEWLNTK